ncbi:MAG: hypothetical protein QXR60_05020 [Candidatus Nanoarchaeia archaeon]
MPFSKSFPRVKDHYKTWEEVELTPEEEKEQELKAQEENIKLMGECIEQAKKIIQEKGMKPYQSDVVAMSIALFEKISSHQVYWKEKKAREKFKEMISQQVQKSS